MNPTAKPAPRTRWEKVLASGFIAGDPGRAEKPEESRARR